MSSVSVFSFISSSSPTLPHFIGFGIPSGPDLFILLIIVLILFGRDRLPGVAKSLGESIKEFKKAMHELERDPASSTHSSTPSPRTVAPTTEATQEKAPTTIVPASPIKEEVSAKQGEAPLEEKDSQETASH